MSVYVYAGMLNYETVCHMSSLLGILRLKPELFPLELKTKPKIYALKSYFLNDPPL
jgi:hypothetical protein